MAASVKLKGKYRRWNHLSVTEKNIALRMLRDEGRSVTRRHFSMRGLNEARLVLDWNEESGSALNEYTEEFLQLIRLTCRIFCQRLAEHRIQTTHLNVFMQTAYECCLGEIVDAELETFLQSNPGLLNERYFCKSRGFYLPLAMRYDPQKFLNLVNRIEDECNLMFWRVSFFPTFSQADDRIPHAQRGRYLSLRRPLVRMRECILDSDWAHFGAILARLELFVDISGPYKTLKNIQRTQKRAVHDFMVTLWRTGLQRILFRHLDKEEMINAVVQYLSIVIAVTFELPPRNVESAHRCLMELYFIDVLLLCLLFDCDNAAENVIRLHANLGRTQQDPEYHQIFNAYATLVRYVKWRKRFNGENIRRKIHITHDLSGNLMKKMGIVAVMTMVLMDSFQQMTNGLGCVFLQVLIHLLVVTDQEEKILDCALQLCTVHSTATTGAIWRTLKRHKLSDQADALLMTICESEENALHEADECWLEWASDRIVHPAHHGSPKVILVDTARRLFAFLDYRSNAANRRAWGLLCVCLRQIPVSSMSNIAQLYRTDRWRWWPRMHSQPLGDKEADEYRRCVFQILDSLLS